MLGLVSRIDDYLARKFGRVYLSYWRRSEYAMVFLLGKNISFRGDVVLTLKPIEMQEKPFHRELHEDPQNSVDLPVGRLKRIVLKKPRIRYNPSVPNEAGSALEPTVEVSYPVVIFYDNYTEGFEFRHYYTQVQFERLTYSPKMRVVLLEPSDFRALRPWFDSTGPYEVEFLGSVNQPNDMTTNRRPLNVS